MKALNFRTLAMVSVFAAVVVLAVVLGFRLLGVRSTARIGAAQPAKSTLPLAAPIATPNLGRSGAVASNTDSKTATAQVPAPERAVATASAAPAQQLKPAPRGPSPAELLADNLREELVDVRRQMRESEEKASVQISAQKKEIADLKDKLAVAQASMPHLDLARAEQLIKADDELQKNLAAVRRRTFPLNP